MKLPLVLFTTCLVLALTACADPGSPGPTTPPNKSKYFFKADYNQWSTYPDGTVPSTAQGSIYSYKDNGATWAQQQFLAGMAVSTGFNQNPMLPRTASGSPVTFSVTLDNITFTGTALVPDPLASVALSQNGSTLSPVPTPTPNPTPPSGPPIIATSGVFTVDTSQPVVVTWSTTALTHPAAWVTVTIVHSNNSRDVLRAAFVDGTLTLPVGWVDKGSEFTVNAANEATNLAPTGNLDQDHAYFRVSNAVHDDTDHFQAQ